MPKLTKSGAVSIQGQGGGRPKKYTDEFIENLADKLIDYVTSHEIPFLKDFCFSQGFGSQRIPEFANSNSKFAEALNRFKDKFESIIVIKSLNNQISGYMAFNTLKNCCGWRDKNDVDMTVRESKYDEFAEKTPEELRQMAYDLSSDFIKQRALAHKN